MPETIRPFHATDLPALYRICLLTGDAGADATGLYSNPDLLGHVYAGPYPVADPGLTFVAVDAQGVAGYVVATADTYRFQRWLESSWYPVLRAQHPLTQDPGDGTRDHMLLRTIHEPEVVDEPLYKRYPAHLHIDLLPRAQRRGLGRRLIEALSDALRERGVPGLHLGVDARNTGGVAFYDRIGFTDAGPDGGARVLTLDLA
ncbi:GNAT family N-acetyltransferase [Cellulomonas sp. URHD0024]|uniref:GNAT family N-acetyltransferase n=1 Tax=Cellulomonas sp. URHD0024 TaxID=1302620 RepID=UPI000421CEFA|nr:GNAT family N-acetyltransferase [Cellulomonas sp. URHD0024]